MKTYKRIMALSLLLCLGLSGRCAAAQEAGRKYESSTYASEVMSYGMLPIYGRDIQDGTYPVESRTNSTYFKLHEPTLTVSGDEMSVTFYIDSTSYEKVYMGSKKEAAASAEDQWILPEIRDDVTWFTIPVAALDQPVYCAAYSKARKRWYGRQLLFTAASLPEGTVQLDLPDYELIDQAIAAYQTGEGSLTDNEAGQETAQDGRAAKGAAGQISENTSEAEKDAGTAGEGGSVYDDPSAVTVGGEDGEFSIEVAMTGGSGRASVSSPTYLTVSGGRAYATLLWSSTHYDYMILDGKRYDNEAEDGGISRFTIPITRMDEPIDIIADTTAMGDPLEIAYRLTFYEESIGDKGMIPQEAAKRVLITALIVIAAGGMLNYVVKRKRRR